MNIKQMRVNKGLTQQETSLMVGMSLRSYIDYENSKEKQGTIKYKFIENMLSNYGLIDEEHGLLSIDKIKDIVSKILKKYKVNYCYLFGSYAKNKANEKSDVDLLIDSKITGLKFYGLIEELRGTLHKKVDLITFEQIENNKDLLNEIFKDGVKIYG